MSEVKFIKCDVCSSKIDTTTMHVSVALYRNGPPSPTILYSDKRAKLDVCASCAVLDAMIRPLLSAWAREDEVMNKITEESYRAAREAASHQEEL